MNDNLIPIPTTFNDAWDFIIEEQIATESECRLVCYINGSSIMSLNDIVKVRTTYHDIEHYIMMEATEVDLHEEARERAKEREYYLKRGNTSGTID